MLAARPVAATLEDVFIALISGGNDGQRCRRLSGRETFMRLTRSALCLVAALFGAAGADVLHAQQSPPGRSIAPAPPQTPSGAPLTLDEAIAQGLANSLRLAELGARQDSQAAVEQGRAAARRPIVAAQGSYTRTNHVEEFAIVQPGLGRQVVYPDLPDNFRTRLDLQWLFYTGGRLDALERAARAERQASGEDLAAARADLRLEITRAFWSLVTAREAEQVLVRALESIAAYVRDLRARLDQGLIPPNELLSAEAQQSRERLVSIEAANARGIAEADLRRLLGTEGPGPIVPGGAAGAAGCGRRRCESADRRCTCRAARTAGAGRARRGGSGTGGGGARGTAAAGGREWRLRLRQPEPALLSAQ